MFSSNEIRPVQIVEPLGPPSNELRFNNEAINRILGDARYADKKVCVVSVAGAFRTGKSFILNFFLRHLRWRCNVGNDEQNLPEDWLGMDDQLTGFSWRGGARRDTCGILIWPEPFLIKDRNGEEIVIILMDTQGIFDTETTLKDNVTVFALSTMISSVQVFNVQKQIQENDLQHLHLFMENACMALDDYNNTKPFQSLLFLIRDWSNADEYEYGADGGQRILDEILEVSSRQPQELQQLRRRIRSFFDSIRCFLMPHPGLEVTNKRFHGQLDQITDQFKTQLRFLVSHLFDQNKLVVKQIGGLSITCRELATCINGYFEVFRGDQLPEPKTIFNATAEANYLVAVGRAKTVYMRKMGKVCGGGIPLSDDKLFEEHIRCYGKAWSVFYDAKKMGGPELQEQFAAILNAEIEEAYKAFEHSNTILFNTKAKATNLEAVMGAKAMYMQEMGKICGRSTPLSVASLRAEHGRCHELAMRNFDSKMMGDSELVAPFLEKLGAEIQEAFEAFERSNNALIKEHEDRKRKEEDERKRMEEMRKRLEQMEMEQKRRDEELNRLRAQNGLDDVWTLEEGVLHSWKHWSLVLCDKDELYIWCDSVALELGDYWPGRFLINCRHGYLMTGLNGSPSAGITTYYDDRADTPEKCAQFIRHLRRVNETTTETKSILSIPRPSKKIQFGMWSLSSAEDGTLRLTALERKMKLTIKEDLDGFICEWEGCKQQLMANSTLGLDF